MTSHLKIYQFLTSQMGMSPHAGPQKWVQSIISQVTQKLGRFWKGLSRVTTHQCHTWCSTHSSETLCIPLALQYVYCLCCIFQRQPTPILRISEDVIIICEFFISPLDPPRLAIFPLSIVSVLLRGGQPFLMDSEVYDVSRSNYLNWWMLNHAA